MKKLNVIIGCFLLSTLLLCVGCPKRTLPKTNGNESTVSSTFAVEKAIVKFEEVNGVGSHKQYTLSTEETADEWTLYFEGKTKLPGNHAWVTINKLTGEAEYLPGE